MSDGSLIDVVVEPCVTDKPAASVASSGIFAEVSAVIDVTPVNAVEIAVEIAVETSSVVVSPERSAVTGSPSDKVRVRSSLSAAYAAYDALVIVASVWAARALVIALHRSLLRSWKAPSGLR